MPGPPNAPGAPGPPAAAGAASAAVAVVVAERAAVAVVVAERAAVERAAGPGSLGSAAVRRAVIRAVEDGGAVGRGNVLMRPG